MNTKGLSGAESFLRVLGQMGVERIFASPGPQFYAYGPIPQEANPLLKVYHAIGFRPGDIVLNTFTYHFTPAGINFDESLGAFGCAVIPAGPFSIRVAQERYRTKIVSGILARGPTATRQTLSASPP